MKKILKKIMKKMLSIIIILCTITLSGCIETRSQKTSTSSDAVIFNVDQLPDDLILLEERDLEGKELLSALFEGLITMDESGKILPGLAKEWSVSSDGIEYRFKIDPEAFWSDGTEITAGDFIEFYSGILTPETNNAFDYQLFSIFGAEDYRNKKVKFDKVAIRSNDKKELIIRLNTPCPELLQILSQPIYSLRNNFSLLRDYKKSFSSIKFSGPFKITGVKDDREVTLERNEYYRAKPEVTEEKILVVRKESPEAAFVDFEMNEVDILQNPPLSQMQGIINNRNTLITVTPDIIGVAFNLSDKSIGADLNFRRAIYEALDAGELAEKALPEFAIPSESFLSYNEARNIFKDNAFVEFKDKAKAVRHFNDITGTAPKSIKLIAAGNDINKRLVRAISEQVKKTLSINVQYKLCSPAEMEEELIKGSYDLLLCTLRKDYSSELSLLQKFTSNSRDNRIKYSSSNYDSVFFKAYSEPDKDKRKKYITECSNILKNDLPAVYLFHDIKTIVKSPSINGIKVSLGGNIDLRGIYMDKRMGVFKE